MPVFGADVGSAHLAAFANDATIPKLWHIGHQFEAGRN
jgi:hypothetical protein